jgi:hypothetical protein
MTTKNEATGESTASRTDTIDQLINAMLQALQLVRSLDNQPASADVPGYSVKLDPQARLQVCAAITAGQRLQLEFHVVDKRDVELEALKMLQTADRVCTKDGHLWGWQLQARALFVKCNVQS